MNDRLDLKQLMRSSEGDYQDNTDGIRRLKHSDLILADIHVMEKLKVEFRDMREARPNEFSELCRKKCSFMYNAYTDIYNRQYKDNLDTKVMEEALVTLKKIENGDINQQEGSVLMGKLFYKVFVNSAVKQEEAINESERQAIKNDLNDNPNADNGKEIKWSEFKVEHLGFHIGAPTDTNRTNKPKNKKGKSKCKGKK
jgi:hypothetical protein|tara:strand:- start:1473 stop:2066 length:594 start_codon:yes stop_codon:yes gene_type:complete